ncbi:MAG: TIGR03905 family TSCPD domain-containing protein [Clostridia bacterium]|nr:TIGR03905 family TSCPD domain-containing protein [Clostridia bacterium]MBR4973238.1 TIGR03905 family TSCPD domain-containing protein [Clostridia bacterium]
MQISYKTNGVCSRGIIVDVEDGIVKKVKFQGGCSGNTQGVAALAEGMKVEDVIEKLQGIKCGFKNTSCPAQLAQALKQNCLEG